MCALLICFQFVCVRHINNDADRVIYPLVFASTVALELKDISGLCPCRPHLSLRCFLSAFLSAVELLWFQLVLCDRTVLCAVQFSVSEQLATAPNTSSGSEV